MSKRTPLTQADIEAGYENEEWLGWGYLGGRQDGHLSPAEIADADAQVLAYANAHGWNADRLFTWLNSRPGRHFADDPTATWAESCLSADLSR